MRAVLLAAALAVSVAGAAQAAGPARGRTPSCTEMATQKFTDTDITAVELVRGERFDFPPSLFNAGAAGRAFLEETRFCRVAGTIEGTIGFEVWLPEDWNGKFQAVGNGGFSGAINFPAMAAALKRGYATASTDMGHTSRDTMSVDWIEGYDQTLVNFGHRAQHLLAQRAKDIIARFYGRSARYAYFNGCSSGGWQGLTEAQKYPDDYDGIIAGAPAHDFVRLQARIMLLGQMREQDPDGNLSDTQRQALADAAIEQCDADDGVIDGIISDPLRCTFDPAVLQCSDGGEHCLSSAQVDRARFLYGEQTTQKGLRLYPGPAWGTVIRASEPQPPDQTGLMRALDEAPDWDYTTFDPDVHIPELEAMMADDMNAMNPDLRLFYGRGGKLIVYHGWMDPGISPYHSIHYYDMVEKRLGRGLTRSFYRLFLAPGMAHCRGGPGPDEFDMVSALEAWVERGEAPERIIAESRSNGDVTRSRPLCAFPQVAVYNGDGSSDRAENFSCRAPNQRGRRQ